MYVDIIAFTLELQICLPFLKLDLKCGVIKQNEAEVGSDTLLISDYIILGFKHQLVEYKTRHL